MGKREMKMSTDVEGDGCLPRNCMEGEDLLLLAKLMQSKAKDTIPGAKVQVELHVDCTKSGGSLVEVGGADGSLMEAKAASSAYSEHVENNHKEHTSSEHAED